MDASARVLVNQALAFDGVRGRARLYFDSGDLCFARCALEVSGSLAADSVWALGGHNALADRDYIQRGVNKFLQRRSAEVEKFVVSQIKQAVNRSQAELRLLDGLDVRLRALGVSMMNRFANSGPKLRIRKRKLQLEQTIVELHASSGWKRRTTGKLRKQEHVPLSNLEWEILPPDWFERSGLDRVGIGHGWNFEEQWVRIALLRSFRPTHEYEGHHSGLRYYYAFVFPSVVIAESAQVGNAVYYHRTETDDWKTVFKKTKREAIEASARRIVHSGDWPSRLLSLLPSDHEAVRRLGTTVNPASRVLEA